MKAPVEQRLAEAIKKLETRHDSIPMDERVADNPDYSRLVMVIAALKKYQETIDKIHAKLDQFDAPRNVPT
jgi:DNA repair ATPase RecN